MFHVLYFVRNSGEYRNVCIKDDHYRITGMNGGMGKAHPSSEFGKYYQQMLAKGWRKVTQREFLKSKYGI
jgi:hypothetical protein